MLTASSDKLTDEELRFLEMDRSKWRENGRGQDKPRLYNNHYYYYYSLNLLNFKSLWNVTELSAMFLFIFYLYLCFYLPPDLSSKPNYYSEWPSKKMEAGTLEQLLSSYGNVYGLASQGNFKIMKYSFSLHLIKLKRGLIKRPNSVCVGVVGLAVAHKASAALVQVVATLVAFETLGVPFEVGRHTQNVLIVNQIATAETY
ncbi:hypothetical protein BpHYR1_010842 [Brachionus plicatilis]|uniref:Uncharacterized protein n=1 Tax=Brachionus plicatilis TaxID=10195 RepID=A0A3M7RW22_BRAPC|nr:hypothetical protein BpHYR1_010842 [Brachionus plicatilis]